MLLKEVINQYPDIRYILFGGKGGLGKTTISAATAYWLANNGSKALVISLDPQANLSDVFKQHISGKEPVEIIPNLFAQEIEPINRIIEYRQEIRQKSLDIYGLDKVPEEIENYIQAVAAEPTIEESAIFDEVVDIVAKGGYDYYIFDLDIQNHALYYLSMVSTFDECVDNITVLHKEMAKDDQEKPDMQQINETEEVLIVKELQEIQFRINSFSNILRDEKTTAFFLVLTPDEMIIENTEKVAGLFAKYGVPLTGYIVNRVIPPELASQEIPDYLRNQLDMQKVYLNKIDQIFGAEVLARVWEFERDTTSLPLVEQVAEVMFGGS